MPAQAGTTTRVQAATGISEDLDGYSAGQAAARQVQAQMDRPDILFCFTSVHLDHAAVLQGIRSVLPEIPLIGGASGATITEAGWRRRAVALLGIHSDAIRFTPHLSRDTGLEPFVAGEETARQLLAELGHPPKMLLLFPRPVFTLDHASYVAGLQSVLPGVPIAGGGAAPDGTLTPSHPLFMKTWQFWNEDVLERENPLVALDWDSPERLDAFAWGHGFMPIGISGQLTRCEGPTVHEIDGRPAIEFFTKYLGEDFDWRVDTALATLGLLVPLEGAPPAMLVHTPLQTGQGGSITYTSPLPEQGEAHVVRTTRHEMLLSARQTAEALQERLGGKQPAVIFMISCGGRHALLGDRVGEELGQLQAVFGTQVPIIGIHGGGEFAPIGDESTEHFGKCLNYSLSLYAIAE